MIKKNNRPIMRLKNKSFIGKSDTLRNAEKLLLDYFTLERIRGKNELIDYDVHMRALFFFEDYWLKNGYRRKQTIGDLSNLYQLVEDQLVAAEVIKDDNLIQSHDGSRILPGPFTELSVELFRFEEKIERPKA